MFWSDVNPYNPDLSFSRVWRMGPGENLGQRRVESWVRATLQENSGPHRADCRGNAGRASLWEEPGLFRCELWK